jgi:hypothetical protein
MKKIVAVLVFMGILLECYPQLRYFLPDSNSYISVTSFKFWFKGDTVIEGKHYKKVLKQANDSVPDIHKAFYYAAVREDTSGEKIFCFHKDDYAERLIADFSRQVGDTVSVYSFWPFESPIKKLLEVSAIDSILIQNEYRRKLDLSDAGYNYPESWIEGIGSTWGLFYPAAFGVADVGLPELLCVNINDTLIYQNPSYDNCYKDFWVGINIKENAKKHIEIFPTVTNGIINIRSENNKNDTHISVFDNQGIKLKEEILTNYINLSSLKTGVYYLVIHVDSTMILTQKILKL